MCDDKRLKTSELIEGIDFDWKFIDSVKLRVFSEEYLKTIKIKCCESGCKNCPWNYKK